VEAARDLHRRGLNPGTAGNASVRFADQFLITPSGVPYPDLAPSDCVEVSLNGEFRGRLQPSSEWRIHRDIYQARSDVAAVVHTHATHATAVATSRRDVPAFHYMVSLVGGSTIRCAPYATFGTQRLSDLVLAALDGRRACLLANHGLVAVGDSLEAACEMTYLVEHLCEVYVHALRVGTPVLLTELEMSEVGARFAGYGNPGRRLPGDP
jgi:L-fuculose-phosphate aldolase